MDWIKRGNFYYRIGDLHPKIQIKTIFNKPATIVFWRDGTKTVVKCQKGDKFDKEKGLLLCFIKKWACGNSSRDFNNFLDLLYGEEE